MRPRLVMEPDFRWSGKGRLRPAAPRDRGTEYFGSPRHLERAKRRRRRARSFRSQESMIDQLHDLLVVLDIELPGEQLGGARQRLEVACLENRGPPSACPVDIAQVVVHDGIGELRVHDHSLEEDFIGYVDMPEEGEDVGSLAHETADIFDALPRKTPVGASAVGSEPLGKRSLQRQAEMVTVCPQMPVLDPV